MENKSDEEKPHSSRKSDVIIITPDELLKLGLIPEIINSSEKNPKLLTDDSNIKEKPNRKSSRAEKSFFSKTKDKIDSKFKLQDKISRTNSLVKASSSKLNNQNKKDILQNEHNKSEPVILNSTVSETVSNKNVDISSTSASRIKQSNAFMKSCRSPSVTQHKASSGKPQILNNQIQFSQHKFVSLQDNTVKNRNCGQIIISENKSSQKSNDEFKFIQRKIEIKDKTISDDVGHYPSSSSKDSKQLDASSEKRFPNKLQQPDTNNDNDLKLCVMEKKESYICESTLQELDVKVDSTLNVNVEDSDRHVNCDENQFHSNKNIGKEIQITKDTSVYLSKDELNQLISKNKNRMLSGKNILFSKKINSNSDVTEMKGDFQHKLEHQNQQDESVTTSALIFDTAPKKGFENHSEEKELRQQRVDNDSFVPLVEQKEGSELSTNEEICCLEKISTEKLLNSDLVTLETKLVKECNPSKIKNDRSTDKLNVDTNMIKNDVIDTTNENQISCSSNTDMADNDIILKNENFSSASGDISFINGVEVATLLRNERTNDIQSDKNAPDTTDLLASEQKKDERVIVNNQVGSVCNDSNETLQHTNEIATLTLALTIPKKRKYVEIEEGINAETVINVEQICENNVNYHAYESRNCEGNDVETQNRETRPPYEMLKIPKKPEMGSKTISDQLDPDNEDLEKDNGNGEIYKTEITETVSDEEAYQKERPGLNKSVMNIPYDIENTNQNDAGNSVLPVTDTEVKMAINSELSETRSNGNEENVTELPSQSVSVSEVAVKLPRKRGRPPRKSSGINHDNVVSNSINRNDGNSKPKLDSGISHNVTKKNKMDETFSKQEEVSRSEIKSPRKRGRPKKISKVEDLALVSVMNISDVKENDESALSLVEEVKQMLTSTPLPKKRGRKKKVEQITHEDIPPEVENVILEESRSGRKRKKVNYWELENEEENIDQEHKRKISKNYSRQVNLTKIEKTEDNITLEEHFVKEECSTLNDSDCTNIDKTEDKPVDDGDGSIVDNLEPNCMNVRKYKKTGETVMMMKSIFAAAFRNNTKCEPEDDAELCSESSSSHKPLEGSSTTGRGQPKKSAEIVDKDNMVKCVICNEKVNNDEWVTHNRQSHNNLAWREGEPELMLDNKNVVTKIVKPILSEDKVIICKKCNGSFQKANRFTNHLEKCNGVISSNDSITCAVCKLEMEKSKWPNHKQRHHNNLAWRVGDRPLNLNDQHLVVTILTALYKAKKPLYCEKCGESKKSVVGFLSHQSQCGLQQEQAKIKCQFCERRVLPVSMQTHVKLVHETPKESGVIQDANYFDINESSTTLTKRKAARTAMEVIQQFSSDKLVQEHSKYYLEEANFNESFAKALLSKEFSSDSAVKCKFNCSFESDSAKDLVEHMNSCEHKPSQYYTCKKCLFISNTDEEVKEHLKNAHDIYTDQDDYENNDNECYDDEEDEVPETEEKKRRSFQEKVKSQKDPAYKVKPICVPHTPKRPHQLFSQSHNYTMSFCKEHYSREDLFRPLRYLNSDWRLLDDDAVEMYLPRNAQSCDVSRRKVKNNDSVLDREYSFKKFELFETECDKGIVTIFCGGPVQAMAWMPTPYTSSNCEQVLAVATLNDFDKKYQVNIRYGEQSLIQFWDFGVLANKHPMFEPKLMFCIAHDFGPVWYVEWCPSGCYETKSEVDEGAEMSRMGLLAVASSDSVVYIYSVPRLKEEQMGLIYKVKPLIKLYVTLDEEYYLNKQKFYATKISWGKVSGHRYVAVGYTDGVVALFDLETSDLLRCTDKDGCEALRPYKIFQPHIHMITVLDLLHLDGGKRWLLTGSFDRNLIVWDLNSNSKIVSKRHVLSDGLWLTNWMAFLATADESSSSSVVPTLLASYRDYMYERVNLTNSSSSVKSCSENCWLNAVVHCGTVGEITAMFLPQLLFGLDNDKKIKNYSYSFGYTKLIDKHLTPEERLAKEERERTSANETGKKKITSYLNHCLKTENFQLGKYEPITYRQATEKYGLLFCDTKMDSYNDFFEQENRRTKFHSEMDTSKANRYSLQAINKVACNPNMQASLYYATGYQAGFVRVTYMKFLEKDMQVK